MPIRNYSVLKGTPTAGKVAFDSKWKNPHYRLSVHAAGHTYEVDINIQSWDGQDVLYVIERPFSLPVEGTALEDLAEGINRLDSVPGTLALDYVRERVGRLFMVNQSDMTDLPAPSKNGSNQTNPAVQVLDATWTSPESATVYAFGSMYSDPGGKQGLHDIHMNQGNPAGEFDSENGAWQDGGLFVQSASGEWIALFIAFPTQSWMTDEQGDPVNAKTTGQSQS
jgi:uncharacterized protein YukJ